jgi:hypothetical protein
MNVVVRGAPFHAICELCMKLVPVAVRVIPALPMDAVIGLILVRTGAGF